MFFERIRAVRFMSALGTKTVAVFGSAQTDCDPSIYDQSYMIGKVVAENNWTLITGGGPGVMAYANKGCYENGGRSFGCNIHIPHEQGLNHYVKKSFSCQYFTNRKELLMLNTRIFVIMPGGFGTLDEVFEILTLIRTNKLSQREIVFYDQKFWGPVLGFMRHSLVPGRMIDSADVERIHVIDTPDELTEILKKHEP